MGADQHDPAALRPRRSAPPDQILTKAPNSHKVRVPASQKKSSSSHCPPVNRQTLKAESCLLCIKLTVQDRYCVAKLIRANKMSYYICLIIRKPIPQCPDATCSDVVNDGGRVLEIMPAD